MRDTTVSTIQMSNEVRNRRMLKITPMLPTIFAPAGTPSRVIAELLTRAQDGQRAPVTRPKDAPQSDREDLPSAA